MDLDFLTKPPAKLDQSLFLTAKKLKDIDGQVWTYLVNLIPEGGADFIDNCLEMLRQISPELKRYYLTRGFDWERGSDGLKGCVMQDEDDRRLQLTTIAYEELGAKEHAQIVRELIPFAKQRQKAIQEAYQSGREFDYDDKAFDPFERRWEAASKKLDFYRVIFKDMKRNPDRYTHPSN
ncbi:MAG: hypothetical protein HY043_17020 [Verrucomicrobia bacterium]|nr:hypothetical protein [Verrucomicrobiota bacterium]